MSTRQWRFVRLLMLGLSLTAAIAVIDYAGGLVTLEQWTYDLRVRHAQHWFAKPTDDVVQVLIDDQSLAAIGSWPWSRGTIADIVDTAVHNGAKQIAFDIVFDEAHSNGLATDVADADNARLARSLDAARAAGVDVLLPVTMDFDSPLVNDPVLAQCVNLLATRLEATADELAGPLRVSPEVLQQKYLAPALERAMAVAARRVVREGKLSDDEAVAAAFPELTRENATSAQSKQYRKVLQQARAIDIVERRLPTGTAAGADAAALPEAAFADVPLGSFAAATGAFAFDNYLPAPDGKLRIVPLVVQEQGRFVPQFGLMLAAMRLGVNVLDPQQFSVSANWVTLLPPGRAKIRIPVRQAETGKPVRPVGALLDIPLNGSDDWHTLYAPRTDAFIPLLEIWRVYDNEQHLRRNALAIQTNAKAVLDFLAPPDDDAKPATAPADEVTAMLALGVQAMAAVKATPSPDLSPKATAKLTPQQWANLGPVERDLRQAIVQLTKALPLTVDLQDRVHNLRENLHDHINGKALVIGWASSSNVADKVATSLHAECPGCVIHGAIANAILSGELWRHLPRGYATALTIVCGMLVTLFVAGLTPWRAFFASGGLMVAVVGTATYGLFDYGNIVIGLAGPVTAGAVCWAACTLVVTLRERLDRAMITSRFRSYVDPELVNYVLEHPDQAKLAGEVHELTVVFVDVAGFTALTEKMGGKSIAILRQLMDALVPIIRKNHGFVNKFLGDGIMFFYGAPRHDPHHARNAVATMLEMQRALTTVNTRLVADGLPELGIRAGISTGNMLVGDAGSADASDYTVLGDAVNLGARLESANKTLGTVLLATARTMELCSDDFFFLPLGRLQVVGKEEAVAVCEPIGPRSGASAEQQECAEILQTVWTHIRLRDSIAALVHLDRLRATGHKTRLCEVLQQLLDDLPTQPTDIDPAIRLTGK